MNSDASNVNDKVEKPAAFEGLSEAGKNLQSDVDFSLFNKASGSTANTANAHLPKC